MLILEKNKMNEKTLEKFSRKKVSVEVVKQGHAFVAKGILRIAMRGKNSEEMEITIEAEHEATTMNPEDIIEIEELKEKQKSKYWLNLGNDENFTTKKEQESFKELYSLSNKTGKDGDIAFVTEDLKKAEKIQKKAQELYKKCGLGDLTDRIIITRQPQCQDCGWLGRFGDAEGYCSACGGKMTGKYEL